MICCSLITMVTECFEKRVSGVTLHRDVTICPGVEGCVHVPLVVISEVKR